MTYSFRNKRNSSLSLVKPRSTETNPPISFLHQKTIKTKT
ncbi:hypothetical protein HMPREF0557_00969 [Listeria innocua ATCC 33091]|uniref:Uncharacterized protein n=1 Tax=Listeria innocua ATCC 33091 TaxID=1002366 RepID=A0AB72ZAC5_LISIO|nr:hypothetical protein HMPREF0557_00969 [Listeria innocua ATCC 33091]